MSAPAKVLAWITTATPWGATPPELPIERAAHSALMAVADFYVAIDQLRTSDEALTLHRIIAEVSASVDAASRAALRQADTLCGK